MVEGAEFPAPAHPGREAPPLPGSGLIAGHSPPSAVTRVTEEARGGDPTHPSINPPAGRCKEDAARLCSAVLRAEALGTDPPGGCLCAGHPQRIHARLHRVPSAAPSHAGRAVPPSGPLRDIAALRSGDLKERYLSDVSARQRGFPSGVSPESVRSGRCCLVSSCVTRAVRCPYCQNEGNLKSKRHGCTLAVHNCL